MPSPVRIEVSALRYAMGINDVQDLTCELASIPQPHHDIYQVIDIDQRYVGALGPERQDERTDFLAPRYRQVRVVSKQHLGGAQYTRWQTLFFHRSANNSLG
jgi:hypothetical protein